MYVYVCANVGLCVGKCECECLCVCVGLCVSHVCVCVCVSVYVGASLYVRVSVNNFCFARYPSDDGAIKIIILIIIIYPLCSAQSMPIQHSTALSAIDPPLHNNHITLPNLNYSRLMPLSGA